MPHGGGRCGETEDPRTGGLTGACGLQDRSQRLSGSSDSEDAKVCTSEGVCMHAHTCMCAHVCNSVNVETQITCVS